MNHKYTSPATTNRTVSVMTRITQPPTKLDNSRAFKTSPESAPNAASAGTYHAQSHRRASSDNQSDCQSLKCVEMGQRPPMKETSFIDSVVYNSLSRDNGSNVIPNRNYSHVSFDNGNRKPSNICRHHFNASRHSNNKSAGVISQTPVQIQCQTSPFPARRMSDASYQSDGGCPPPPTVYRHSLDNSFQQPINNFRQSTHVCPQVINVQPQPAQPPSVCQHPTDSRRASSRFSSRTSQHSKNSSDSVAQCLNIIPECNERCPSETGREMAAPIRHNSFNCPSIQHSTMRQAPTVRPCEHLPARSVSALRQQVGTCASNSRHNLNSNQSYVSQFDQTPFVLSFCKNCGQFHVYYYNPASINYKHCQQDTELLQHVPCMSSTSTPNSRSATPNHHRCSVTGAVDSCSIQEEPTKDYNSTCPSVFNAYNHEPPTCNMKRERSCASNDTSFKVYPAYFKHSKKDCSDVRDAEIIEALAPCKHACESDPKETTWRVKITKDCGSQTRPAEHGIRTQTSDTRIITADTLERLLPPAAKFDEDIHDLIGGCLTSKSECPREASTPIVRVVSACNDPIPMDVCIGDSYVKECHIADRKTSTTSTKKLKRKHSSKNCVIM